MFSRIGKFQQQPELWKEIEKITIALRAESDTNDSEKQFLCEMFRHISSGKVYLASIKLYYFQNMFVEVQHKLLLFTADHCEDTMEHCRLLLLLLQRFPTAISSYGVCVLKYGPYYIINIIFLASSCRHLDKCRKTQRGWSLSRKFL